MLFKVIKLNEYNENQHAIDLFNIDRTYISRSVQILYRCKISRLENCKKSTM